MSSHPGKVGRWILVLFASATILAGVAALILSTDFAHGYILAAIVQRIQDATGGRVEIGRLSFHRAHLGADFYGIRVRGTEPDQQTPLFSAERVAIDLGLHLFHRTKLDLQNVAMDHPVMHLSINSKGDSNLPRAAVSTSPNSPGIFDMAIGHFVLNSGEIFYNDRHAMVNADLRNLNAQVSYGVLTRTYDGTINYHGGRIDYGSLAPMAHDLSASFSAAPSGLVIKSVTLLTSSSSMHAQGEVRNYADPSVYGSYEAKLATRDLGSLFKNSAIPEGELDTQGNIAYVRKANEPAINALAISGTLSGRSLKISLPEVHASLQNIAAEYQLNRGNLEVRKMEAAALGGRLTGRLLISRVADDAASQFDGGVQKVSLSAMQDAWRTNRSLGFRMGGQMAGKLQATWHGNLKDVKVFSDATLAGSITSASSTGHAPLSFPVNAAAQVTYDDRNQSATIHNALIHTSHSYMTLTGGLGKNADLKVDGRTDDLREVDLIAGAFGTNSNVPGKYDSGSSQPLDLSGAATFSGTVSGQLSDPHVAALLTSTNLHVRGTSVQAFRANVQLSRTKVTAQQGEIKLGPQAGATFDISLTLRDWQFAPDLPLNIHLNTDKVSVTDIERIAGLSYPVTGLVSSNVAISGTQEDLDAQGNIRLLEATAWQQPIQMLTIGLQHSSDDLDATFDLRTPAGSAKGALLYYPKSRKYNVQATSTGIRLDQVQYLQSHAQKVTGIINASVKGQGDLNAPQLEVTIDGQPQIGNQKIDNFRAQANVANQRSEFSLNCSIAGAALQSHGVVNLTGDYEATANLDSQVVKLDSLLSTFLPQANNGLHGQTEFHAALRGPLKNPDRLEAHIEIPALSVGYSAIQIATDAPIHADYQQGVLAIPQARLKGTGTDLRIAATVPLQSTADLRATADGTADLELLQLWDPQWQSSGQIKLNIGAQGNRSHPELKGTIAVSNAGLSTETIPALEKINGELDISGERIQIKNLAGQSGGGTFEIHGFAIYQPSVHYSLGMTARGVRLFYPEGVRTQFTADLNLTGEPNDSLVSGQVTVYRLSLTQAFDLATFSDAFSVTSAPSVGMADNIKLNVGVSSSRALEVSNNQLSVEGSADLHLQGTVAEPVLVGRTNVTGGELFFKGKRFQMQDATIVFANPVHTEPVVNLTATTTINHFNLTVNLVGPFDKLRTTYTSDPPLSQVDVINLLITGHTTAQSSSVSPQSVVASQLSGQVSSQLEKLTGISSLTIDPQIGGNQGNAGSQVAIQQRVTKDLFFTFATDVTNTQGEVVQVEYQVTPKYSLSAIRNQTGGYEIEIKSHKKF